MLKIITLEIQLSVPGKKTGWNLQGLLTASLAVRSTFIGFQFACTKRTSLTSYRQNVLILITKMIKIKFFACINEFTYLLICFRMVGRVVSFSFPRRASVASSKINLYVCFGMSNARVKNMLLIVHALVHWEVRLWSVSIVLDYQWETTQKLSKHASVTM